MISNATSLCQQTDRRLSWACFLIAWGDIVQSILVIILIALVANARFWATGTGVIHVVFAQFTKRFSVFIAKSLVFTLQLPFHKILSFPLCYRPRYRFCCPLTVFFTNMGTNLVAILHFVLGALHTSASQRDNFGVWYSFQQAFFTKARSCSAIKSGSWSFCWLFCWSRSFACLIRPASPPRCISCTFVQKLALCCKYIWPRENNTGKFGCTGL